MGQTNRRTSAWPALAVVLAVSFSALPPAVAADSLALEREQLAALARQLDLIDRLAEHAANTAPQERARYHFDYARLRADLKRVRAGLQNYLVPQRAQPRRSRPAGRRLRPPRSRRRRGAIAMTPSADQVAAFQANGGFAPSAVSAVVLGFVFAVLLLWGVWAMRTAYVGWAEHRITERQFLAVVVRFVAMYLVLTFFLLS